MSNISMLLRCKIRTLLQAIEGKNLSSDYIPEIFSLKTVNDGRYVYLQLLWD